MNKNISQIMITRNMKSLEFVRVQRENAKFVSQSQEDNLIEEDVDGHSQIILDILQIELRKYKNEKLK